MKCPRCKGKGYFMVANGPDDVDHEFCDDCDGTGFIQDQWENDGFDDSKQNDD